MLSIVIPTLNESAVISQTIRRARENAGAEPVEIIVSDCNSGDGTRSLAEAAGATTVCGGSCRATALNAGAACARGRLLLFLHADTLLPPRFADRIAGAMRRRELAGGAFDFSFNSDRPIRSVDHHLLNCVVLCNRLRFRVTGNFYGDQAIFVRRQVFERIGGFPPVRLMEDLRFSRYMRRYGRTVILRPPVQTSPRRFLDNGVLRQFIHDLTLLGFESLDTCIQPLWARYNQWNQQVSRTHQLLPNHMK